MKFKYRKCKCGCENLFLRGMKNQVGMYCIECGRWIKWANGGEIILWKNHLDNLK